MFATEISALGCLLVQQSAPLNSKNARIVRSLFACFGPWELWDMPRLYWRTSHGLAKFQRKTGLLWVLGVFFGHLRTQLLFQKAVPYVYIYIYIYIYKYCIYEKGSTCRKKFQEITGPKIGMTFCRHFINNKRGCNQEIVLLGEDDNCEDTLKNDGNDGIKSFKTGSYSCV